MIKEADSSQNSVVSSKNIENKPFAPLRLCAKNSSVRISTEMIERAKRLPLPDLMRRRNLDLMPSNGGSAFKCKCPFHDDKEPSLNLNIKDGIWLWNCFGCGEGGTNIDFLMKYENMDFVQAVKSVSHEQEARSGRFPEIPVKPECSLPDRIRLLSLVGEYYFKLMQSEAGEKGLQYLQKRGLLDDELIKSFKIGFSDGRTQLVFKDIRAELKNKIGIFSDQYYDFFTNCVIFPVLDEQGGFTDIYGRRICTYQEKKNHLYNNGEHIGIFNISNVRNQERIILTECIIDALSVYKAGFKNVTAFYGVNGMTPALEELLLKAKEIIFALDNDEAGNKAFQKYSEKFSGGSRKLFKVSLPADIKDVNELLCKSGMEAVKKAVEEAEELTTNFTNNTNVKSLDHPVKPDDDKPSAPQRLCASNSSSDEFLFLKSVLQNKKFQFKGSDLVFNSPAVSYLVRDAGRLKRLNSLRFVITASHSSSEICNLKSEIPCGLSAGTYTDRVDLYLSRSRRIFENEVSRRFDIQSAVIEKDLADLIAFIEEDFRKNRQKESSEVQTEVRLSEGEIAEAIKFLKFPNLIKTIISDLSTLGYVGEDENKLLLYLAATSRKLEKPISVLIRSQSSTGKSFLIDKICDLLPEEDVHKWTSLTPKALYYMAPDALKHKFIAIDERAGMEDAEYPIRSLQSGARLSLAVPIKNPTTGETRTELIIKEGPISYVDGSTDTRVNPENANRCFEIFLDETPEQTKRVQHIQKRSHGLEGWKMADLKDAICRTHQNSQRLLKPVKVIIPFIDLIEFPTDWIRTRRDHERFLSLIVSIAFLHQYQREKKEFNGKPYIEATLKDYAIAYKLAKTVLFNTFQELEKPVFDFYLKLSAMVEIHAKEENVQPDEYMFTRRMIRQFTKLPDYLAKRYTRILKDLEYFEVKSNGNGSKDIYRLVVHTKKTDYLIGLTTPSQLKAKMEEKKA